MTRFSVAIRRMLKIAGPVLGLALLSSAPASAQAISGPSPFSVSNNGLGTHSVRIGTGLVWSCVGVAATGGTHDGVVATFTPEFTQCNANVGGIPFPARYTVTGAWRLTPVGVAGSNSTFRLDIGGAGAPAMKVQIGAHCAVNYDAQSLVHGTNGTLVGINQASGLRVNLYVSNMRGSSTGCPAGWPTTFTTSGWVGSLFVPGMSVS